MLVQSSKPYNREARAIRYMEHQPTASYGRPRAPKHFRTHGTTLIANLTRELMSPNAPRHRRRNPPGNHAWTAQVVSNDFPAWQGGRIDAFLADNLNSCVERHALRANHRHGSSEQSVFRFIQLRRRRRNRFRNYDRVGVHAKPRLRSGPVARSKSTCSTYMKSSQRSESGISIKRRWPTRI